MLSLIWTIVIIMISGIIVPVSACYRALLCVLSRYTAENCTDKKM